MSQNHRRSRNGGVSTRIQPSILKARKRKISGNELDSSNIPCKEPKREMVSGNVAAMPLEDVTSISLNVDRDKQTASTDQPEDYHKFRGLTCYPTPQTKRKIPFPAFTWADRERVWELMCRKDSLYKKDPNYLSRHPALQPRMRAILLDWLTEVCEVYKLHRETYYLATDYIDRYLTATKCMPKQQLQLLGITCLFIAAKIEEIYPPKLSEFSFVTDGACTDNEILEKELIILKTLNWDLNPITSNSWLNTFLQLLSGYLKKDPLEMIYEIEDNEPNSNFIFPRYSGRAFIQVIRYLDLCTLDMSSLNFSPSKLAATALRYLTSLKNVTLVSGYTAQDLQECWDWMAAFALTLQDLGPVSMKAFSQISFDDLHNIQTHSVDLETLEQAQVNLVQLNSWRLSPPTVQTPVEALTPPKTDEKVKNAPD